MRFIEADVCYCSNCQIVNDVGWPVYSVFVATRCQAVENVNYRVHRLATVANPACQVALSSKEDGFTGLIAH